MIRAAWKELKAIPQPKYITLTGRQLSTLLELARKAELDLASARRAPQIVPGAQESIS
jgi:hypothetical protein